MLFIHWLPTTSKPHTRFIVSKSQSQWYGPRKKEKIKTCKISPHRSGASLLFKVLSPNNSANHVLFPPNTSCVLWLFPPNPLSLHSLGNFQSCTGPPPLSLFQPSWLTSLILLSLQRDWHGTPSHRCHPVCAVADEMRSRPACHSASSLLPLSGNRPQVKGRQLVLVL